MNKSQRLQLPLIIIFLVLVSLPARADTLMVAVGLNKPPYVIDSDNSGFELELIKAIFNRMGHSLSFLYVPYARSSQLLITSEVDIVMTQDKHSNLGQNGVLSQPYITYKNVAISLKQQHISIDKITDLAQYPMVAFQRAHVQLGKTYALAAKQSPQYIELADQRKQVEMLKMNRTRILIMDINIFNHFGKIFFADDIMQRVDVHPLFPTNSYSLGFNDKLLRQAFDLELGKYKHSAAYRQLIDKYDLYWGTASERYGNK